MKIEGRHADALVVSVHFKASEGLLALLRSLQGQTRLEDLDVIIVDNSTGNEDLSAIRSFAARLPNAHLLESSTNRGYFGGAKGGLDRFLEQAGGLPDWVIVCNHDVLIEEPEFF